MFHLGRKISLVCVASGKPRPHITWLKDGIELNSFSEHEHVSSQSCLALDYNHSTMYSLSIGFRVEDGICKAKGKEWNVVYFLHSL